MANENDRTRSRHFLPELSGLSKGGKSYFALACLLELISSLCFARFIFYSAEILRLAQTGLLADMLQALWWSLAFLAFKFVAAIGANRVRLAFLSDGTLRMRAALMGAIFQRPLRSFRAQNDAYYLNLLGADTDLYALERLDMIHWIFCGLADLGIYAVALFLLNPWLLAISVVLSAPPFAIGRLVSGVTQRRKQAYSNTSEGFTATLKEGIEGYETLRMGQGAASYLQRFLESCRQRQQAYSASSMANAISMQMLYGTACLLSAGCTAIGGWLLIRKVLSVSMLFAAVSYSSNLSNAFSNLAEYLITLHSAKKIAEKLHAACQTASPAQAARPTAAKPELCYERVSFSFGERKLYEDFSYRFEQNGCYAVIGESGSGKSTLLKLLLKYYDDYSGTISLSGRDIRALSEDEVFAAVGVVEQTPFLFNASLYENIMLFRQDLAEDSNEYRKLLQDLNLTALAERVGNQPLGDFGDNISGGERQRISIARTMWRQPRIVLFDEPTTGLDPENGSLINRFIFEQTHMLRIVVGHNWDNEYLERFDGVIRVGADDGSLSC